MSEPKTDALTIARRTLDDIVDFIKPAHDLDAVDLHPYLLWIIIHKGDRGHLQLRVALHLTQHKDSRIPCTGDNHSFSTAQITRFLADLPAFS